MPYKNIEQRRACARKYYHSIKGRTTRKKYIRVNKYLLMLTRYFYAHQNSRRCTRLKQEWAESNRGKTRKANQKWGLKNRESRRANCALRRARKLKATIGDISVIHKVYARAVELRQWFDVVVDHIKPLARGGAHSPENLQIIYRLENLLKSTKINYTPSIIFT